MVEFLSFALRGDESHLHAEEHSYELGPKRFWMHLMDKCKDEARYSFSFGCLSSSQQLTLTEVALCSGLLLYFSLKTISTCYYRLALETEHQPSSSIKAVVFVCVVKYPWIFLSQSDP